MKPLIFKTAVALLIVAVLALVRVLPDAALVFHSEVADYAELARELNIRNMVTAVYLGPRILDTLIEVLVVVLAVQGMAFVRETQ